MGAGFWPAAAVCGSVTGVERTWLEIQVPGGRALSDPRRSDDEHLRGPRTFNDLDGDSEVSRGLEPVGDRGAVQDRRGRERARGRRRRVRSEDGMLIFRL
jgi:hypothetical protein